MAKTLDSIMGFAINETNRRLCSHSKEDEAPLNDEKMTFDEAKKLIAAQLSTAHQVTLISYTHSRFFLRQEKKELASKSFTTGSELSSSITLSG